MKAILFALCVMGSMASAAGGTQTLVCSDESSQLKLDLSTLDGAYDYNKTQTGEYGSVAILGCTKKALDHNWDLLDCEETTYSVYWSLYQIPKDILKRTPGATFSVIEMRRSEDRGEVNSTSTFQDCRIEHL